MKQSMDFEQVITRVQQEAALRLDFYAPANALALTTESDGSRLATPVGEFQMRNTAHRHLAELTGIDRRYYERLRQQAPALLDQNVNFWLAHSGPKPRMIRTLGADARAVVSPRYGALDNDALLATVEPIMAELAATVESADLSDEKLVVKLISSRLTGDVKVGDAVQAGLVVSNSEVRAGAVEVQMFVKRLVCLNGLALDSPAVRGVHRRHISRVWAAMPQGGDGDQYTLVPDTAERAAWQREVWDQVGQAMRHTVSEDVFGTLLERLRRTTRLTTQSEPEQIVTNLGGQYGLRDAEQGQVLQHLYAEYDGSLWNIINAVTRTGEDAGTYERATELEQLGGRLATLSQREWERLVSVN